MFPQLTQFADLGFLLLRLMVGAVFITSGWSHLKDPEKRGQSIGMSKGFTIFLGAAEVAGSLGVIFGVLTQLAALGLILIMLGAIQKKIFVWHTGFLGRKEFGMALRSDAGGDEPGHSVHRWRALGADEVSRAPCGRERPARAAAELKHATRSRRRSEDARAYTRPDDAADTCVTRDAPASPMLVAGSNC